MAKILTRDQALGIAKALSNLNIISARRATFSLDGVEFSLWSSGLIEIAGSIGVEFYASQGEFRDAYAI